MIIDHIEGWVDVLKGKQEEKALEWKVKVIFQILSKLIIPAWLQSLYWRIVDIEKFLQLPLQSTGNVPHLFASFCLYLLHKIGPPTCGCTSWFRWTIYYQLREARRQKTRVKSKSDFLLVTARDNQMVRFVREKKLPEKKNCPRQLILALYLLLHYLGLASCDCARWSNGPFFWHGWESL